MLHALYQEYIKYSQNSPKNQKSLSKNGKRLWTNTSQMKTRGSPRDT